MICLREERRSWVVPVRCQVEALFGGMGIEVFDI